MALSPDFSLHQVAVELQYDRGIVYLDKCGSLMLKLVEQLGEPFTAGETAGMEYADVTNTAERIVVRYGRRSVNVTQSWPTTPSPVRLEQLAPVAWDVVADTLNVRTAVTRCGVRYWLVWRVDSLQEGRDRVRNADLFVPGEKWDPLFGDKAPHGWAVIVEEEAWTLRMGLDFGATAVQGALPADLANVVPKFMIILDCDHFFPDRARSPHVSVSKQELKEFIRKSWQRTKLAATTMGKLFGA